MKLCIHCKHIRDMFRPTFEKCAAIDAGPDLVTGEPKSTYCSTARALEGPCGHEGKLWEPIEIEVDNATF